MFVEKNAYLRIVIALMVFFAFVILLVFTNVFGLLDYDDSLVYELRENLDKAAIKYVTERNEFSQCFYNIPPGTESDCAKYVTVKELMDEGYFEDEQEWCDLGTSSEPTKVMVYNFANDDIEDIVVKAYGSDDICK